VFYGLAAHNDINRTFKENVHAISSLTFGEEDLTRG
jgi:hypothetical protein